MERMEEYTEEESPVTEPGNLPRDPILEDLTTNSSELLQTVKYLKSKKESVKRERKDFEGSGGAESDSNRKVSNWG